MMRGRRWLLIGLLGAALGACGDGEMVPAQGLAATWEMRQVAAGMVGLTTLQLKRDGSFDLSVVSGRQQISNAGGWTADDTRLTLSPTTCSAGPPCPPVVYQYALDTSGRMLTLIYQPIPGGGTATLMLTRK